MRQAGVLAAAGLISLEIMTKRLGEDHIRAQKLAEGLSHIDGVVLDDGKPYTNMVYFNLASHIPFDENALVDKMMGHGVLIDWSGSRRIRLVTHYWIDNLSVEKTLSAFQDVFSSAV